MWGGYEALMKKRATLLAFLMVTSMLVVTAIPAMAHHGWKDDDGEQFHWHEDKLEISFCEYGDNLYRRGRGAIDNWNDRLDTSRDGLYLDDVGCADGESYVDISVHWSTDIDSRCDSDEKVYACTKIKYNEDDQYHSNKDQLTRARIWVGKNRWKTLSSWERDRLLTHEFGHAVGLDHWEDCDTVMNSVCGVGTGHILDHDRDVVNYHHRMDFDDW